MAIKSKTNGRLTRSGDGNQLRRLCFTVYASWEIWKQRNNWVFEGEWCSTSDACRRVRMQVEERMSLLLAEIHTRPKWIFWIPPPGSVIKANFDAAVWDTSHAVVGSVLRNARGELLAAGFLFDYSAVDAAEARGAWEAIRLNCQYFSDWMIWFEGDAYSVVQSLQVSSCDPAQSVLIKDARGWLASMEVYKISHIHREGNQCADWITKWT